MRDWFGGTASSTRKSGFTLSYHEVEDLLTERVQEGQPRTPLSLDFSKLFGLPARTGGELRTPRPSSVQVRSGVLRGFEHGRAPFALDGQDRRHRRGFGRRRRRR